jgi:hypothetical protein
LRKFALLVALFVALEAIVTACDSLPLVSLNSVTATPSRTPRPTFTPRSAATETAVDTDTPAPTEVTAVPPPTEPPIVQEPDTPTRRPVVRATKPPAPPPATPQPPPPQFAVHPDFGDKKFCPQDNIYEIVIYIKRDGAAGNRPFAGGLYFGAFSGGQLLKDGAGKNLIGTTDDIGSLSYGANCNVSFDRLHPNQSNGKIDVGDAVRRGTTDIVLRFIRSETDLTPISADVPLPFSQGGRWWTAFGYSGG